MSNEQTKEAPKPLSPSELFEELEALAQDVHDWEASSAVREAEEALKKAKAKVDRLADQKLRIMRAKTLEEARAIADEKPAEATLKKLCQRCSGWKPLQEKGGSDEQIMAVLMKGWPHSRPYPYAIPQAESPYESTYRKPEPKDFKVWVDPDKAEGGNAHMSGAPLLAAIRKVMGIEQPAKASKKPAPAKPAAKAPAKKATKPAAADDDAEDGAAPTKASPKPKAKPAGGPAFRKQTWGQFTSTLRKINGGVDLSNSVEEVITSDDEKAKFFYAAWEKGTPPAQARDAWLKRVSESDEAPSFPVSSTPAKSKPRQTWRQFASTVKHLPGGVELRPSVHEVGEPDDCEQFFLDRWKEGVGPSEALKAWMVIPSVETKPAVASRKRIDLSDAQIKSVLDEAKHCTAAELMSRNEYVKDFGADVIEELLARGLLIALRGVHDGDLDLTITGREWLENHDQAEAKWSVGDIVNVKGAVGVIDRMDDNRSLATVNFAVGGARYVAYGDLREAVADAGEAFPFKKGDKVLAHGQSYTVTEVTSSTGPNGVTLYDLKTRAGGQTCYLTNYYVKNGKVTNGIDELVAAGKGKPAA